MPPTNTTAERVLERVARVVGEAAVGHPPDEMLARIAAALSSHGLRELVERSIAHVEATKRVYEAEHHNLPTLSKIAHQQLYEAANEHDKALTTMLGEGETLKAEEQADG